MKVFNLRTYLSLYLEKFTYPMKLYSLLGLLCLFTTISITSCEKSDVVKASGTCTFKVGDITYSANTSYGEAIDTSVVGKKALYINGLTNSMNSSITLLIFFPDSLATGIYTEAENAQVLFTKSIASQDAYVSQHTTIKITSINSKYAEGTFDGILDNGETEVPLTDGKFKVNIN